jgi:hypothetical protein
MSVDCDLVRNWDRWQPLVNTVMNFRVLLSARNFLNN